MGDMIDGAVLCEVCQTPKMKAWEDGPLQCPTCVAAARERLRVAREAQDRVNREQYLREQADTCVPQRYRTALLRDFSDAVSTKVRTWINSVDNVMHQLLIFGPVGTGKTHLACAITREIILSRIEKPGPDVKFTSQAAYLRDIRKSWDSSELSEEYVFGLHTKPRILVLDDIGAARGNENDTLRLGELIAERYDNMKPSVFVTNLTPDQLKAAVGDRSYDRMRDNGVQIVLNGESRRRPAA